MNVPHYSCLLWSSINLCVIFEALHKKKFIQSILFHSDICTMAIVLNETLLTNSLVYADDGSLRSDRVWELGKV